jgi:hypothetical protein
MFDTDVEERTHHFEPTVTPSSVRSRKWKRVRLVARKIWERVKSVRKRDFIGGRDPAPNPLDLLLVELQQHSMDTFGEVEKLLVPRIRPIYFNLQGDGVGYSFWQEFARLCLWPIMRAKDATRVHPNLDDSMEVVYPADATSGRTIKWRYLLKANNAGGTFDQHQKGVKAITHPEGYTHVRDVVVFWGLVREAQADEQIRNRIALADGKVVVSLPAAVSETVNRILVRHELLSKAQDYPNVLLHTIMFIVNEKMRHAMQLKSLTSFQVAQQVTFHRGGPLNTPLRGGALTRLVRS